jgi:SAM-dependent methyltransferase
MKSQSDMAGPTARFTSRVENYVKYRPSYPAKIIQYLEQHCALTQDSIIADIGSGTGISARPLLEHGNTVHGVEPNEAMRKAGEEYLAGFEKFVSVNGTAEATSLSDGSVDLVIAAQAFHWFDPDETRKEFCRILKPGGHAVLIWNERQLDSTPFLIEYEALLEEYATDYKKVRHENVDQSRIADFLGGGFGSAVFANEQVFDFEGLKGRVLSSSYMPDHNSDRYGPMIEELSALFAKHERSGKITILYDTRVYHSPAEHLCQ